MTFSEPDKRASKRSGTDELLHDVLNKCLVLRTVNAALFKTLRLDFRVGAVQRPYLTENACIKI